eukprot:Sdes_comp18242_c0_seq1m7856
MAKSLSLADVSSIFETKDSNSDGVLGQVLNCSQENIQVEINYSEKQKSGWQEKGNFKDQEAGLGNQLSDEEFGNAPIWSCIFNLCATTIGAGILSIPLAMADAGLYVGIALYLVFFGGAIYGLRLLLECATLAKIRPASFYDLSMVTFPWARYIIDGAVLFDCWGVAASYLIVIGENMAIVMLYLLEGIESPLNDRRIWISLFMVFIIPISLFRSIHKLRYVSGLAFVTVLYMTLLVVYYLCANSPEEIEAREGRGEFQAVPTDYLGLIRSLPIMMFSFTCHQNIYFVHNEMKNPTKSRTTITIVVALSFALILYLVVGVCGYMTHLSNVTGNLLSAYPPMDKLFISCRCMVSILVAFSFPLQIHPARVSLDKLLFSKMNQLPEKTGITFANPVFRHYVESAFLLITAFAVSLLVKNLSVVFAVIGSTGSTILCYLVPAVFYMKLSTQGVLTPKHIVACFMVIWSVFMLIAGNYVAIFSF